MKMDIEVVKCSYRIEVSVEDHKKIVNDSLENETHSLDLFVQLENIYGVGDVDYDGLSGPYFYLSIDKEYDHSTTWLRIQNTFESFLEGLKKQGKSII